MTQHPAWFLIVAGLVIVGIGIVWLNAPSMPWLGKLPGDIAIERENFKFYFPIMTFVLCGFEHSIANMYFLPAGLLTEGRLATEPLIMFRNLIPVTVGNIIGGLLVILLHPAQARRLARTMRAKAKSGQG